jgi:hypothetical protein
MVTSSVDFYFFAVQEVLLSAIHPVPKRVHSTCIASIPGNARHLPLDPGTFQAPEPFRSPFKVYRSYRVSRCTVNTYDC